MKSRDTLIRLKRFQLEEKRRRVGQIEMMLAEFTRMIGDLDREIANEEKRAGIADPAISPIRPTLARHQSDATISRVRSQSFSVRSKRPKPRKRKPRLNSSNSRRWKCATRPTTAWPKR